MISLADFGIIDSVDCNNELVKITISPFLYLKEILHGFNKLEEVEKWQLGASCVKSSKGNITKEENKILENVFDIINTYQTLGKFKKTNSDELGRFYIEKSSKE